MLGRLRRSYNPLSRKADNLSSQETPTERAYRFYVEACHKAKVVPWSFEKWEAFTDGNSD